MIIKINRCFLRKVCGSITPGSDLKWAPSTQWSKWGEGILKEENYRVRVHCDGKLIFFDCKEDHPDMFAKYSKVTNKMVEVYHRNSPLGYNAYYNSEVCLLEQGEVLPEQYTLPVPNRDKNLLFGIQSEQEACVPSFVR